MSDENKDIRKRIDAYIKGSLTEDQITELWVEFAKQPNLLDELELEVGVKEIIEKGFVAETTNKASIKSLPNWTWHAAAAAVLIIVAGIQFLQIPSKSNLDQFLVNSINSDQLETANGIRSKQMVVFSADSLLNLGFNEFVNGNSTRALTLFNEVISDYDYEPYGSKAYLNKGIVYYNESSFDSAIVAFNASLSRVSDSKMIEEKAYWYLGNSFANIGQLEEARTATYQAYSMEGVFRKPAFLLLQKLNYDLGYSEAETVGE
jgi:tetratricopeptide (TPR) repeat protein